MGIETWVRACARMCVYACLTIPIKVTIKGLDNRGLIPSRGARSIHL